LKLSMNFRILSGMKSPPARGRGLKHGKRLPYIQGVESPPARGRGLKRLIALHSGFLLSRPPRGGVD